MQHVLVVASRRAAEEGDASLLSTPFNRCALHMVCLLSTPFHRYALHMVLRMPHVVVVVASRRAAEEAMLDSWMIAECPQSLAAQNGVVQNAFWGCNNQGEGAPAVLEAYHSASHPMNSPVALQPHAWQIFNLS